MKEKINKIWQKIKGYLPLFLAVLYIGGLILGLYLVDRSQRGKENTLSLFSASAEAPTENVSVLSLNDDIANFPDANYFDVTKFPLGGDSLCPAIAVVDNEVNRIIFQSYSENIFFASQVTLRDLCPEMVADEWYTLTFETTIPDFHFELMSTGVALYSGSSFSVTDLELSSPLLVVGYVNLEFAPSTLCMVSSIMINKGDGVICPYQPYFYRSSASSDCTWEEMNFLDDPFYYAEYTEGYFFADKYVNEMMNETDRTLYAQGYADYAISTGFHYVCCARENYYYLRGYLDNFYDDGYNNGYHNGYEVGKQESYDVGYNVGYDVGWEDGHFSGYYSGKQDGYDEGYPNAYADGYTDGYNDITDEVRKQIESEVINDKETFLSFIFGIFDAPLRVVRDIFNFEIFGINISDLVLFVLTCVIVVFVVRKTKGD